MVKLYRLAGLALLGLAAWCGTAGAQVIIRAPFVSVDVFGPNVSVRAPFVGVDVRGLPCLPGGYVGPLPPRIVGPVPFPVYEAPPARQTKLVEVPSDAPRAVAVSEFVNKFSPTAGKHTAVLIHPGTGEAVTVQFTLPEGCRKVSFDGNKKIVFDCGDEEVAIRFMSTGAVKVDYLQ